jgi:hypothetical protein
MSKKLIAVASAAALAISALVAVPASATGIASVAIDAATGITTSHTSRTTHAVAPQSAMTSRTLDYRADNSSSRNVVRFVVSTTAATTPVTVTASEGVTVSDTLVDAAGDALNITAGKTSLSGAAVSSSYTFYAWTTSTTPGTVVITTATTTLTYYVKGVAGGAYNLVGVKFPTAIISGEANSNENKNVVSFSVTDVFGNVLTSGVDAVLSGVGASFSGKATYNTTRKVWESNVFGAATANVSMQLDLTATDLSANGFAKPVIYAFSSVSGASLAERVTALTAQVAALQATLANRVTKKRYNTLARKWNKAFPTQKVALKK